MSDLSSDELVILTIAAEGESMAPIGRWEKPVERLVQLGFLHSYNRHNNVITPAGRMALDEEQRKEQDTGNSLVGRVATQRRSAAAYVEEAAKAMAAAVQVTATTTGEAVEVVADKWLPVLKQRVLELVQ